MIHKIDKILVATTNPGKVKEIHELLSGEIELVSLKDFSSIPEVEEDGATFEENARQKAVGYAKSTGCFTIADDSGLVVDALDGAPGVRSARFSGKEMKNEGKSLIDHRNIKKVLELLKNVPKEERTARFVCCICLASPERILIETRGTLEGFITGREIGTNGFGYDPILYIPALNKTVAQLTKTEKNNISHRSRAIHKLMEEMRKFT
jgi:XTP/dITP diphosphohydrolase